METRLKSKKASRQHPSPENECERVSVEVRNLSGVQVAVFWVDSDGDEVGATPIVGVFG